MKTAKVRCDSVTWKALRDLLFIGYPRREAATFLRCGWAEGRTEFVITIHSIIAPHDSEVEREVGLVALSEDYTLRTALHLEKEKFAVGLVHSHPQNSSTCPSFIDDEMDGYFSDYFLSFIKNRPYLSFIVVEDSIGELSFTGRLFIGGEWIQCSQLQIISERNHQHFAENVATADLPKKITKRLERFSGVMGQASAQRMWRTKIGIIGAGGTGSALFHSLLRSCVGQIVTVDSDLVLDSNSERVHGFKDGDVELGLKKVEIMARLGREVNPLINVVPIAKDATHPESIAALIECDYIFGCTDSEVGRLITSDVANRFLIPAIQVNVSMETDKQSSTLIAQVIHITQYGPRLACAYCRDQIDPQKLTQEMLSHEEREKKQKLQKDHPHLPGAYWKDEPILHTVGSLTTAASEIVAQRAIGFISGNTERSVGFLEYDLMKPELGAVNVPVVPKAQCTCGGERGTANQLEAWFRP